MGGREVTKPPTPGNVTFTERNVRQEGGERRG